MSALETSLAEIRAADARGWVLTPLKGKRPVRKDWQNESPLPLGTLLAHVRRGGNVGLRTGAVSGVVVIDCDKGADIRALHLPLTVGVETGGGGRHYYFAAPKQNIGNSASTLAPHVDVRGDGGQVVYPGSTHPETGAVYEWLFGCSPEEIDLAPLPAHILDALRKLKGGLPTPPTAPHSAAAGTSRYSETALSRAVETIRTAPVGTRNDTLNREAFAVAGLLDLDHPEVARAFLGAAVDAGLPEKEARATIAQAMRKGAAAPRPVPERPPGKGARKDTRKERPPKSPSENGYLIPADEPLRFAERLLRERFTRKSVPTLRRWRDEWLRWTGTHYASLAGDSLRKEVYDFLDLAFTVGGDGNWKKAKHSAQRVNEVIQALVALPGVLVPPETEAPVWLDDARAPTDAGVLPCRNGLLDLESRKLYPHSPSHFNQFALPLDYDAAVPPPAAWLDFLAELWPETPECTVLLRQWFGYCIARDTSYQKMLLLIGPKRSGKGTIARILQALMGAGNSASPTLASLAENFGLQSLIGKPLAVIADARLSGRSDQAQLVERLLSISGEDAQSIPRKFLAHWHGKLPTRFMIISNELPRLQDVSGALASRFLVLPTERSFFGHEDRRLFTRLSTELPGILNWALDGWRELEAAGRFTIPAASEDLTEMLGEVTSPVGAFVEDCCVVDAVSCVRVQLLFDAWRRWCTENGREHPGTVQTFGRDLRSICPSVRTQRSRSGACLGRLYNGIRLAGDPQ